VANLHQCQNIYFQIPLRHKGFMQTSGRAGHISTMAAIFPNFQKYWDNLLHFTKQ
jgi:hypothetical protein